MVHFRLPDDFSGSIADALREMADYHGKQIALNQSGCEGRPFTKFDMTLSEAFGMTFDEFIDAVQTGKRLVGLVQLRDFDPKVIIKGL